MSNKVNTHFGVQKLAVDLSANSTAVYAGPCILVGMVCANDISAHDVLVLDGAATVAGAAASSPAGTSIDCFDMPIDTSLTVDPNDSATGILTVMFIPDHEGLAGSGAGLP